MVHFQVLDHQWMSYDKFVDLIPWDFHQLPIMKPFYEDMSVPMIDKPPPFFQSRSFESEMNNISWMRFGRQLSTPIIFFSSSAKEVQFGPLIHNFPSLSWPAGLITPCLFSTPTKAPPILNSLGHQSFECAFFGGIARMALARLSSTNTLAIMFRPLAIVTTT